MNEKRVELARRRVRRLRDFYTHVAIYAVVMGGLFLLNWVMNPGFWWVAFPAAGWGIGLAAHAISVFFEDNLFGSEWEARKTREMVEGQR